MYKVEFIKSALQNPAIPKSSKCILSISLGAVAYEGHKLIAILSLINKNFSECKVIIGDTLSRHNLLGEGTFKQQVQQFVNCNYPKPHLESSNLGFFSVSY